MKKALFVTLDNTLIKTKSGNKYSLHSEDWKFINQAVECIRFHVNAGYMIIIIINQKQITDGITTEKTFNRKLDLITKTLERDLKLKKDVLQYEYCIDETSFNFLPKPGMIYQLALEFELGLRQCCLLGNLFDKDITLYSGIGSYIDVSNLNYQI